MTKWLRIEQAAEYCGVSGRTIRFWIKHLGLKVSRLNQKLVLIKDDDLDQFLEGFSESTNSLKNEINNLVDEVVREVVP